MFAAETTGRVMCTRNPNNFTGRGPCSLTLTLAVIGLFGASGHGPTKDHRKMKDAFEMSGAVGGGAGVLDSTTAKRPRHHFRHSEITCDRVVRLDLQCTLRGGFAGWWSAQHRVRVKTKSFSAGFFRM